MSPSAISWGDLTPRVPSEPRRRRLPARKRPRRYEHLVRAPLEVNGTRYERDPQSGDLVAATGA
jgi:hypothetical protein